MNITQTRENIQLLSLQSVDKNSVTELDIRKLTRAASLIFYFWKQVKWMTYFSKKLKYCRHHVGVNNMSQIHACFIYVKQK